MSQPESRIDRERRLRRAAITAATRQPPEPVADEDENEETTAARHRMQQQARWTDLQIRSAIARGDFDNLPGAGKPLKLPDRHDPDWWVKSLIERERITGVLPPALALRKEHAELEAHLDRQTTERAVRRTLEDFNARVVEARRQLLGGPPVITPVRDVEHEVAQWARRRDERRRRQQELLAAAEEEQPSRRRWWERYWSGPLRFSRGGTGR